MIATAIRRRRGIIERERDDRQQFRFIVSPEDGADYEDFKLDGRMQVADDMSSRSPPAPLVTPDGRYILVRGRLWRAANPALEPGRRKTLVAGLMTARRAVATAKRAGDRQAEDHAHADVQAAKVALGERGPVWWDDGAPDLNRHMARTTCYADWYAGVAEG